MSSVESVRSRVEIAQGDICALQVDAIVNAANESLLPGGGVCGAIHRAAGPGLLDECRSLGWCNPGEARITAGYRLPARWILHTVGPVWEGGGFDEDATLARSYRSCYALARERGIRSIAFPAISTGIYGFPAERATRIALTETRAALEENPDLQRVVLTCFSPEMLALYERLSLELLPGPN